MFKAIVLGNVLLFISTLFVQLYFTILHFQKKLKNMYFFKIKNCMLNMKKICKIRKAHSGQPSVLCVCCWHKSAWRDDCTSEKLWSGSVRFTGNSYISCFPSTVVLCLNSLQSSVAWKCVEQNKSIFPHKPFPCLLFTPNANMC